MEEMNHRELVKYKEDLLHSACNYRGQQGYILKFIYCLLKIWKSNAWSQVHFKAYLMIMQVFSGSVEHKIEVQNSTINW